jgi:hypothetical protein
MVSQGQCKLTSDGEKARDALLELLYPHNSYTNSQLGQDTDLDRGATIPKILGNQGNMQQVKLKQFFKQLLLLLKQRMDHGKLQQSQIDDYLQNYCLTEPYRCLKESEQSFYLPSKLYGSGDTSSKSPVAGQAIRKTSPKSANRKSSASLEGNVTDLFWHLDYRQQERAFEDALDEWNQCVAFSIAAPCDTTQRWILNRLKRQIPDYDNALSLCISLKQNPMRNQFKHFWEDLSQRIGTNPLPNEVLEGMCHANVDRPIILTIYEFRQFEKTQKQLFQDFWEPLTQAVVGSKRSKRSRIVLFLVDQCYPSHNTEKVVRLDPLKNIPHKDVENWLASNTVSRWWQPKFGDGFEKGLAAQFTSENCQEPYFVLDKICVELGIENGLVDVEEAWKWAS